MEVFVIYSMLFFRLLEKSEKLRLDYFSYLQIPITCKYSKYPQAATEMQKY